MLGGIVVGLWVKAASVTDAAYRLTRSRALAIWGSHPNCEAERGFIEYIELTRPGKTDYNFMGFYFTIPV